MARRVAGPRALAAQPDMIVLAALLAIGAVAVHAAAILLGQPLPLAVLASAQLGVPVAAVTIGTQEHLLAAGEGGTVLAAALVTVTAWTTNSERRTPVDPHVGRQR